MNTRRVTTSRPTARTGFSLIEVLIAVLVLAVGLLGLASVFPVVISQQRDASDVIRGGTAASAIRDQIRSNSSIAGELMSQDGFADDDEPDADGDRVPNDSNDSDIVSGSLEGEPVFGLHDAYDPDNPNATERRFNPLTGFSYLWEADWQWGIDQDVDGVQYATHGPYRDVYLGDGGVRFRDREERRLNRIDDNTPDLPMIARVFPRPYSASDTGRDGPQYVWDFVPRRTPSGDVQFAVFVRRIDTGIRIPAGGSLSGEFIGGAAVAVGRDGSGRPTLDGSGEYSVPVSAQAVPIPAGEYPTSPEWRDEESRFDYLRDGVRVLTSSTDGSELSTVLSVEELEELAHVGQRFVDNLGVVRTVVEVLAVENDSVDLRVDPPLAISTLAPRFDDVDGSFSALEAARVGKLRQIVFTPQSPVDVFTMEFSK